MSSHASDRMGPRGITLNDLLDCIKNGRIGGDQPVLSAPTEHVGGFTDVTVGPNDPRVREGAAGASKDDGMMAAALDAISKDLKRPRRLL